MPSRELSTPLVVVGGGLGGVAAALTAARLGQRVVLTEETDWLGGQLTSQGVPPDEHQWIDSHRISPSYSELRDRIRDHYRNFYPLTDSARADALLNPGAGFVSRLCHEPRVAAIVIEEMLSPLIAAGLVTVLREHRPIAVVRHGAVIEGVLFLSLRTGDEVLVRAGLVADATELGDLLELGGLAHTVGAESAATTGELHAPEVADPLDQQAVTWCAALEFRPGEDHTIDRPVGYQYWKDTVAPFWPGSQLSWDDIEPISLQTRTRPMFAGDPARAAESEDRDLWHYRRVLARANMEPGWPGGDVTLMNWPQADYWNLPLLGVPAEQADQALAGARDLTLSLVHWMQTEAPRSDGGAGYPELRPRGDVMGTTDGLAKAVYVRESRRIHALFTVTEAHIGRDMRGDEAGSEIFADSVGIGYYRIDLHPSTSGRSYVDIDCFPFQIPLGALIPADADNLLASNKNIGTTHITNGAYRLHPVEWSIGEAVGALAAYTQSTATSPAQVRADARHLEAYQHLLSETLGVALGWEDDIRIRGSRSEPVAISRS
ncbi:FAD-dependent oxidoreductase [Herbiconiux sp. CPCC 205763]|uniref:FAD-dependent oxidoreductase n=1 Tax=Herbiconiux aconitum TaxID=2970913 RepID=A0ABT2GVM3_9MICO|nr:FAD-dependent oxidoreductase [Herbiconiux aconitum]MCS5720213.1 FAD-dependent oxidoreductase [Herbiconiux aconitum]